MSEQREPRRGDGVTTTLARFPADDYDDAIVRWPSLAADSLTPERRLSEEPLDLFGDAGGGGRQTSITAGTIFHRSQSSGRGAAWHQQCVVAHVLGWHERDANTLVLVRLRPHGICHC